MKNKYNYCLWENKCYGRDSKGKNIMLYAFEPIRIVTTSDLCAVVKKQGKGQQREYLVFVNEIHFLFDKEIG